MNCDWITLCDSAYKDADNKTCIIGVFDLMLRKSLTQGQKPGPTIHPRMFAVVRLVGNPNEVAELTIEIAEPAGNVIASGKGNATLGHVGTGEFFVRFDQLPIPHVGIYSIRASIGGSLKRTASLVVEDLP
jgi:hypothetical protein